MIKYINYKDKKKTKYSSKYTGSAKMVSNQQQIDGKSER